MNILAATQIELWAILGPFLAGPVAALLTGLVTATQASSTVKAIVNLAISAIAGSLLALSGSSDPDVALVVVGAFIAWITSIATHFGFWKPTTVTEAVSKINGPIGR